MKRKKTVAVLVLAVCAGAGIWYAVNAGVFEDRGPTRLPTAEELERIRNIEQTSSERAPNAKAGAGVLPPGTMPRTPEPTPDATSTGTSTEPAE